jgi:hypothetical protein
VQKKFMSSTYRLCERPVPLKHIWTAAEAQMNLMMHTKAETPAPSRLSEMDIGIPFGSKVFVMAGDHLVCSPWSGSMSSSALRISGNLSKVPTFP